MVISDVGDSVLDSGIFIKAGFGITSTTNFASLGIPYTTTGNSTTAVVACSQGIIPIELLYPARTDTVIHFIIGGTGVNGTDYTSVADSVRFNIGDSIKNINIQPLASGYTGTRSVSIIIPSPCGVPDTAIIYISNALSSAVASSNTPVCTGGTAVVQASTSGVNGTYIWAPGGQTTSSITVSPATTSYYSVTFTSQNCGTATATDTVTVVANPSLNLTERDPRCNQLGSVTATAFGGDGPYQYSLDGGTFQAVDSFTGLNAGTYSVVAEDSVGCRSNPAVANVSAANVLSLALTIDSITCISATGQIIAVATGGSGTYQYSINGGTFQPSDTFGGLTTAVNIIDAEDTQGCAVADTVNIARTGIVAASAMADSVECYNTATGTVIAGATGGNQPYQYSLNGGAFQSLDTFESLIAGNYTLTVKDGGGCQNTTTVQVFQPDSLYVDSVIATAVKCYGDKNGTITVTASGGTPKYTYSSTTDSVNFEIMTGNNISGLATGSYAVFLSDSRGCTLITSAFVPNAVRDTFLVNTDSTSCYGPQYKDGAIIIDGLVPQNAPFVYALDSGTYQPSDTLSGLGAGNYEVSVENANGCVTELYDSQVGAPAPSYAIVFPKDTTIKLGSVIQLQSYLIGGGANAPDISYMWSPSAGLSCAYCQDPVANGYAQYNTYTVTVTYDGHCTANATVNVDVDFTGGVFIPSGFSPNGDGNNDIFEIYGAEISHVDLLVFNRWGEKVFEGHNQFAGWDGTYKGILQMPAVFTYEANVYFLNGTSKPFKGTVSLVR